MKRSAVAVVLLAGALSGMTVLAANPKPPPAPAVVADAPTVQSLAPMLEQFKWGINHQELVRIHNQTGGIFDQDYNPQLAKLQPGVQMQSVEAEREQKKAAFAASFVEFKDTPTGFDTTGIHAEYTYKNKEAVMAAHEAIVAAARAYKPDAAIEGVLVQEMAQPGDRAGKRRYFFFIGAPPGDRLWKIYDEVKLVEGGPMGKTYQEAITKLNVQFNTPARIRAASAADGLLFTTSDWQDSPTHLRALDRSREGVVAIVIEDRAVLGALPSLRSNQVEDPMAIDPSISAVTRGVGRTDPNASRDAGAPDAKRR